MAYKALARASVTIELFEDNERYEANVVSTNGVILQPYDTSTTLIGSVLKNGVDITSEIKDIRWTKWNPTADNLVECPEWNANRKGYPVIEVTKDDIDNKSLFTFEAYNINGDLLCSASISLIDINDLLVSTKEPENPYIGQLWVDDSKTPASLYVWNGYKWILAGAVGAVVKNFLLNSNFTFNSNYWDIVGETRLSYSPYSFDHLGKRWLKLQSDMAVDTKRGISQTVTEGVAPNNEYSYQMLYFSTETTQTYSNNIFLKIYSIDKFNVETVIYEKVLTADKDMKRVYARFNSLEDTVAIKVEICGENKYRYHFNITEAALYNTHNDYPWTINPQDLKMYADNLSQEDLWNILSCGGTIQGIFSRINPDTGQLDYFINASYIQAGKMKAEFMEMYNLKVLKRINGEEVDEATLEIDDSGKVTIRSDDIQMSSGDTLMQISEGAVRFSVGEDGKQSFFTLTEDELYMKAENIKLEGYTTINDGFIVDLEGNMHAKNGTFEGTMKASTVIGTEVRSDESEDPAFLLTSDGTLYAKNANIEGTVTGSHIEGATIKGSEIEGSTMYVSEIYSDRTEDPVFSLSKEGELKAYNATISGKIEGAVIEGGTLKNKRGTFSVEADGILNAEGAVIKGDITAGSTITGSTIIGTTIQNSDKNPSFIVDSNGTVTGAKIQGGTIGIGNGKNYNAFTVDQDGNCNITKGSITIGENFKVTNDGTLIAKSGNFTGDINSGSTITGATIIGTSIQNKAINPTFMVDKDGNVKGANLSGGSIDIGNGNFVVNEKGELTAKSGSFTGSINAGTTIKGATIQNTNGTFKIDKDGNISGGSININDAFIVTNDGKLTATEATITGKIIAESGEIRGDTLIDGNCIATGSISAAKLIIGDTNNYCELNEQNCADFGFVTMYDPKEIGTAWLKLRKLQRDTPLVEARDDSPAKRYTGSLKGSYRIQFECSSSVRGALTSGGSDIDYLEVNVGLYCKTRVGGDAYYIPFGCKTTSTETAQYIDTTVTIPNTVQSFGVYLQVKGYEPFSGVVKVRNVRVTRMTDEALIVNGSITADHIEGRTLTGVTLQNKSKTFRVDEYGNIVGAKITGSAININDKFTVSTSGAVVATDMTIKGGSFNINDKFKVSTDGKLTATGADISGKLTATSGTIGGFTIGQYTIKGGNVGMCSTSGQEWAFWAGASTGAASPFHVGHDGKLYASDVSITGEIVGSVIRNANNTFYIDQNGNITGASLKSSGGGQYGNFSIDSQGNMQVANLAVEGEISSDIIICNEIRSKKYPATLTSNVTLYVTSDGNDANGCYNNAKFYTLQGALNSIPKNMNGKTAYIYLQKDTSENITFTYFSSGRIYLYMTGKTITGHIGTYCCEAYIAIYGGTSSDSTRGYIKPINGYGLASRTCSIANDKTTHFFLSNIDVYAANVNDYSNELVGISTTFGRTRCISTKIINVGIGFRAQYQGHIHVDSSSGIAISYGFQATAGGIISLNSTNQAGGKAEATNKGNGGQIWYNNPTFESGQPTTAPPTSTPTPTNKTATYYSSGANAIQYYGQSGAYWRSDNKPKVGTWGYGPHTAWWFFGDDFGAMASKNVYQIDITYTRQQGGNYAAHSMYFYTHNYETQPSTKTPSYWGTCIGSSSVAINTTGTFKITDSTIINQIKKYKGICSIPSSQSNAQYAVFSGSMTVKFYYKE